MFPTVFKPREKLTWGNSVFHFVAITSSRIGETVGASQLNTNKTYSSSRGDVRCYTQRWRSAPQIAAAVRLIKGSEDKSTFQIPKVKM